MTPFPSILFFLLVLVSFSPEWGFSQNIKPNCAKPFDFVVITGYGYMGWEHKLELHFYGHR